MDPTNTYTYSKQISEINKKVTDKSEVYIVCNHASEHKSTSYYHKKCTKIGEDVMCKNMYYIKPEKNINHSLLTVKVYY